MAVTVISEANGDTVHSSGNKWVVDENQNLVVLGTGSKAVAIYAKGDWTSAEVTA